MKDNTNLIKHYEKEIENAENEITENEECKRRISKSTKNLDIINRLNKYSEGKKEVFQTLLNDLEKESQ